MSEFTENAKYRANELKMFLTGLMNSESGAELVKKHNLIFIVDNCFAAPYLQRPLEFGADLVIHSATKLIDGQGRVLGGVTVGKAELIKEV